MKVLRVHALLLLPLFVGWAPPAAAMLEVRHAPIATLSDSAGEPIGRVEPGTLIVVREPNRRLTPAAETAAEWARPCCSIEAHSGARWSLEPADFPSSEGATSPPRVLVDGRATWVQGGHDEIVWLIVPHDAPTGGPRRLSFGCGRGIAELWVSAPRVNEPPVREQEVLTEFHVRVRHVPTLGGGFLEVDAACAFLPDGMVLELRLLARSSTGAWQVIQSERVRSASGRAELRFGPVPRTDETPYAIEAVFDPSRQDLVALCLWIATAPVEQVSKHLRIGRILRRAHWWPEQGR